MVIKAPNIVWQSDITYIEVGLHFYYAVFIIDVYTREIVGYSVSDHLRATANMKALAAAARRYGFPYIHHSDRGSQYIYTDYVNLLKAHQTQISMALAAQENAYAERINGIIKREYLDYWKPRNLAETQKMVRKAVIHYNTKRPHQNLARRSPQQFKQYLHTLHEKDWPALVIYKKEDK